MARAATTNNPINLSAPCVPGGIRQMGHDSPLSPIRLASHLSLRSVRHGFASLVNRWQFLAVNWAQANILSISGDELICSYTQEGEDCKVGFLSLFDLP